MNGDVRSETRECASRRAWDEGVRRPGGLEKPSVQQCSGVRAETRRVSRADPGRERVFGRRGQRGPGPVAGRSTAGAVSRSGWLEPPEHGWRREGYLVRSARAGTRDAGRRFCVDFGPFLRS